MANAPKAHNRHEVREKVLQALYALEISKNPVPFVIETVLGELQKNPDDYEFATKLFLETTQHQPAFDVLIKKKAANWEFHRIALIDKILLRMGICEMMYFDDIPPKVSINEAIEIAKDFSTDKSGTFINGILDSILTDLRKEKTLSKKGRGLLE